MKFLYGLVVVFLLLEGIIIQCNATNGIENSSIVVVNENQPSLPDDLVELILYKGGLDTIRKATQVNIKASKNVMKRIFADRIIVIDQNTLPGTFNEYFQNGDLYFYCRFETLMKLFKKFGENTKRILLNIEPHMPREIIEDIIKKYAGQLTEIHIMGGKFSQFWDEISNSSKNIYFPKVKKFYFYGTDFRNSLDLNAKFPKLESFNLNLAGPSARELYAIDTNCFANVTKLTELILETKSLQNDLLDKIFSNNKKISKLVLSAPSNIETLRSIEKNLKNLKTLKIANAYRDFFTRKNNVDTIYKLKSVTYFVIEYDTEEQLVGDFAFDMPNLEKLEIYGLRIDDKTADFINHFKGLETVKLRTDNSNIIQCLKKLTYVKEFIAIDFQRSLASLIKYFEKFDKTKSNVDTIKLELTHGDSIYTNYKRGMLRLNNEFKKSNKPTWTLSLENEVKGNKEHTKYLMFKRDI